MLYCMKNYAPHRATARRTASPHLPISTATILPATANNATVTATSRLFFNQSITFPINRQHVSGGVAVREEAVLEAMASAWQDFKLVVEPGGAVALAALLSGAVAGKNKTTIIIASGGNVDAGLFRDALKRL